MPMYEIEYSYDIREGGATTVEADDNEQAEQYGREYVLETFDDIMNVSIDGVRELKKNGIR